SRAKSSKSSHADPKKPPPERQKKMKTTSAIPNFAAKNCLVVNTKLRGELRRITVEDIREETTRISAVVEESQEEKRKRVDGLVRETNEAVEGMKEFLDETCAEYDSMLDRFSPPEEISIDEIVDKMEEEFRSVFDIYKLEMVFDVGSTRVSMVEGGEEELISSRSGASSECTALTGTSERKYAKLSWKMMEDDVKRIKTRCEANVALEMELTEKIARENQAIEQENMKTAAARHEEEDEMHENEKKMERLRREIEELESTLPENARIATLTEEIEELKEERRRIEKKIEEVEERARVAKSRSERASRPSR
ncbi:hypothetical protein PMAYCL1PPCAC_13059, partial [Pristionchus mayeri]